MKLLTAALAMIAVACTQGMATRIDPSPTPIRPSPSPSRSPSPSPSATPVPVRVEPDRILEVARAIVRGGPRHATSEAFRAAARVVERELRSFGYDVRRQRLDVPAGVSWGVAVPAGRTFNVVADPPEFDPREPHLIVGAHLDTVPQSPGADDNASGVAVVVELARLAALRAPETPIRFVAFTAEEPRARDNTNNHLGSLHYVEQMQRAERRALVGMVSLDRVGLGAQVRVCVADGDSDGFADRFLRRARALDIDAVPCRSSTSDHLSFELEGMQAIRLLGADNPDYHTPRDRFGVLERAQLRRVTRLAWQTLRRL